MEVRTAPSSRLNSRRIYWAMVIVWGLVSLVISDRLADDMKFRINDLSTIYGAGQVMRDNEGTFYHVNSTGKARRIFPVLEGPVYKELCLDCTLVTGEQLAQVREFCAAGVRTQLPAIDFELPCKSWAVMGDGTKVVGVTLFLVPILLWPLMRGVVRALSGVKNK
jgi:hypothetical protein